MGGKELKDKVSLFFDAQIYYPTKKKIARNEHIHVALLNLIWVQNSYYIYNYYITIPIYLSIIYLSIPIYNHLCTYLSI